MKAGKALKITTIVTLLLAIVFLGSSLFVFLGLDVSAKQIDLNNVSCRTIKASETSDSYYIGTAEGLVQKRDTNDNLVWQSQIVDGKNGVHTILDIEQGAFVIGEDQYIYSFNAVDGTVLKKSDKTIGLLPITVEYTESKIYLFGNVGTNNDLFAVMYDYDLNRTVAQFGSTFMLKGAAVPKEGNELFVMDNTGMIYSYDKDLTSQNFGINTYIRKFEVPFQPVSFAFNREENEFYVAGKNNILYGISCGDIPENPVDENDNGVEIKFESVKMSNDVQVTYYDKLTNMIYVTSKTMRTLYVFDTEGHKMTELESFFDIQGMEAGKSSDSLYILVFEPDSANKTVNLYYYDRTVLPYVNLINALRITFVTLTILSAAVFFVCLAASKSKAAAKQLCHIGKQINKSKWIYLFLFPSIVALIAFCYYPAVSSLIYAFLDYRVGFPLRFIGFDNFISVFNNPQFFSSVKNMLIFLVTDLVKAIIPPLIFAELLMAMRSQKLQYASRVLLYVPGILPGVAGILVWTYGVYGINGLVNQFIGLFGMEPIAYFATPGVNIVSLIFIGFPFVGSYLIFYGALKNIPDAYYEAAKLEGCSWFRRILTIDIPLLKPQAKYVLVMGIIASVQDVGRIMLTTGGAGNSYVPVYIMYNYISYNMYGYASAIALMIFAMLVVITTLNMRRTASDAGGEI